MSRNAQPPATQRYLAAADAVVELVAWIPADLLDRPGLGEWDLRALIGHTWRSLITVDSYLDQPVAGIEVASAAAYYPAALGALDPADVRERGRAAGAALGDDPAGAIARLVGEVRARLAGRSADQLLPTAAGGMLLGEYLRTRTFELVVHGTDIAVATGLAFDPPDAALADAVELAGQIAVLTGRGGDLLLPATRRQQLPPGFSVV